MIDSNVYEGVDNHAIDPRTRAKCTRWLAANARVELHCECLTATLKINLLHRDVLLPFERLHFGHGYSLGFALHSFVVAAAAATAAATCWS